jgi:uncharacterized protein YpmB
MKKEGKKNKWIWIILIIVVILLVLTVAGYFILKQIPSSESSGYGVDYGKGSVDFGEMGNSNAFKDMKLNPFDNNG